MDTITFPIVYVAEQSYGLACDCCGLPAANILLAASNSMKLRLCPICTDALETKLKETHATQSKEN